MNNLKQSLVRKRLSYSTWLRFLKFLATNPDQKQILLYVHGMIDARNGYGSKSRAVWSRESLDLALEDFEAQGRLEPVEEAHFIATHTEGGKIEFTCPDGSPANTIPIAT